MKKINWDKQKRLLNEVENCINTGNIDNITNIFKDIFGNDTNYIYAVVLTESNPEYSLYSKELYKHLYKYYIDTLMSNIRKI